MISDDHFILKGRLIGTDEGWVTCSCGWHTEGTVKETIAAGEKHLCENVKAAVGGVDQ